MVVGVLIGMAFGAAVWTVALTRADGRQIMRENFGAMSNMTPVPEPEAEVEADPEVSA